MKAFLVGLALAAVAYSAIVIYLSPTRLEYELRHPASPPR
jgi:hypothetical protein